MTVQGYTRRSTSATDTQPVGIIGVDLTSRQAQGLTRVGTTITIDCSYGVGSHLVTPSIGEQWYVERVDRVWRLGQKIPFNDDNLLIEPVAGQTVIGGSGPIELNGNQVNAHSPLKVTGATTLDSTLTVAGALSAQGTLDVAGVLSAAGEFVLGGTRYRTRNNTLEYQQDNESWIAVGVGVETTPYDLNFVHSLGSRQTGYGDNPMGIKMPRDVTFTAVTYRCRTADASGNLVVELRRNGATVTGSEKTIGTTDQISGATATGNWNFAAGDILTVRISQVGNSPGQGLVADIAGSTG